MDIDTLTGLIIEAALEVHSSLGPGLLEHTHHACLKLELISRGFEVNSDVAVPGYGEAEAVFGDRTGMLVEDQVVIETKSVEQITAMHRLQLFTYLKLADKPVGLVFNFQPVELSDGIIKVVNAAHADIVRA